MLLDSLSEGTFVWDKRFASMSREGGHVLLPFQDGTEAAVGLVVGCDGAGSKARPNVTSAVPHYSGVTIVECTVHEASRRIPAIATGTNFNDAGSVAAWFARESETWYSMWLDVVDSSSIVARPQYFGPLDQHWEPCPDLTLLDDAAHVMPPYAGAGMNNAMLDAPDLTDSLLAVGHGSLQHASGPPKPSCESGPRRSGG